MIDTITKESRLATRPGPRTRMNNLNDHVIANERLACRVDGCETSRYGWSAYCRSHAKRSYENGNPTAQPLTWPRYRKERREVAAFLSVKGNRHHAAIIAVSEELRQRIAVCDDKAGEYWYRMQEAKVQPLDIILIVSARFLHAQRHGSLGDQSDRFVHTEIGKGLVKTFEVAKAKRPDGKQEEWRARLLRALGASVLEIAGDLCTSIATAVEKERAILDDARAKAKSAKFTSPSTGEVLA